MKNEVLEYIGLNLEKIPKELQTSNAIHFYSYSSSNTYKVYDYISVHDLEILITPLDRTAELKERLKKARPLAEYLLTEDSKMQKLFADVLYSASVTEIKKLESLQEKLIKQMPYFVKYDKNYLWQIYYSKEDNKYFMLFPANEGETSVLFYIIKKKLEKEDTRIFVPISKLDYSEKILSKSEMNDIENYIWLITNDWPNIYEVSNKKIYITGKAKIANYFESNYRNVYDAKEKAKEFYMLLKAIFILTTETNYQYTFEPYVNNIGELEFKYKDKIINMQNFSEFIENEAENKKSKIERLKKEIEKNEKILKELTEYVKEQNNIYVMQEKRIAMFLQCKNSFFKKISYFFKSKKFVTPVIQTKIDEFTEEKVESVSEGTYTIKELIKITTEENEIASKARDLRADIRELQLKKENLARKIKNASEYIAEIEEHKKSIFEFWKFTNKDEMPALMEGEKENAPKTKILGTFNLDEDLEILGVKADSLQRQKLTVEECNSIYIMPFVLDAINHLEDNKKLEEVLIKLKENLNAEVNIFEDLIENYTQVKKIKNREHRENERNVLKILNINKSTTAKEFKENLEKYKTIFEKAYKKIKSITQMNVYAKYKDGMEKNEYVIANINPQKLIISNEDNITLHKINVDENTNILYFSNIVFFENNYKTLPLGMDLSTDVILKMPEVNNEQRKELVYILTNENDFESKIKKIEILETVSLNIF